MRLTISDKQHEKWTKPANREAAIKFLKVCRAHEEIEWLDIEIQRLEYSIKSETEHTEKVLEALTARDPALAAELERRWKLRSSVNKIHCQRLAELKAKPYFTGRVLDVEIDDMEDYEDLSEEEAHFEVATDLIVEMSILAIE